MTYTLGSLCSGYGGFDIAVDRVLGTRMSWFSEVDEAPSSLMRHNYAGVPNIGDIKAVDWGSVQPVDVITAGYPCQPFSVAGKREGANDPRHLWPFIHGAIRTLRPKLVVLENVQGHLTSGGKEVLWSLAEIGFDAEWAIVRASDVGACHRRARLFIVATDAVVDSRAPAAPDANSEGLEGREPAAGRDLSPWRGSWADYEPAIRRHEHAFGRSAPAPVDERGRLSPRFVEWMMMLPDGWVTSLLPQRTKSLKALGNGVVPSQAEYAIRGLLHRLGT